MNETLISFVVIGVLFAATLVIAVAARAWIDKKDLKGLVSGKHYARRYHISEERITACQRDLSSHKPAILVYFRKKHFRVVSAQESLWAISPPYANLPVLVSLIAGDSLTIRICDRYLQPIMIGRLKRRFQKHMTRIINDIEQIVEQSTAGNDLKAAPEE